MGQTVVHGWAVRALLLGSAGCALMAVAVVAPPAPASTPPKAALTVNVKAGMFGAVRLGSPVSAVVGALGWPDYAVTVQKAGPVVQMIWSRSTRLDRAWAALEWRSRSSPIVAAFEYAGPFRTPAGDHLGTTLAAFLRRWPQHGTVRRISVGRAVEYNVIVGRVVFAFDAHKNLAAVGLAAPGLEPGLCAVPATCVSSVFAL